MNRIKKIIINVLIIVMFLGINYCFSSFYFSKDKCIEDMLEFFDSDDNVVLREKILENGIELITTDRHENTMSFIKINKYGLLYSPDYNSQINRAVLTKEGEFEHLGFIGNVYDSGEYMIGIYRNNKNINNIKVTCKDGRVINENNWIDDFMFINDTLHSEVTGYFGLYQAFDKEGNLIDEINY